MSKDRLLGSTLANSWNFCMSCFLACLMCWLVAVIKDETIGPSGRTPDGALLAIIFGLVLVLQLMELPTVGKKFSCSIIPLLILALNNGQHPNNTWRFLLDSVVGAGCAIVGNVLPFPIEYSVLELRKRTHYCAVSTTSLLLDIIKAWQYQSCFSEAKLTSENAIRDEALEAAEEADLDELTLLERSRLLALRKLTTEQCSSASPSAKTRSPQVIPAPNPGDGATSRHVDNIAAQEGKTGCAGSVSEGHGSKYTNNKNEHRHWRKLRLLLMAVIRLKRIGGKGLGWYFSNNSCGTKFLRIELTSFLREGIDEISARIAESQFASTSPLRRYLSVKYEKYASLLRDALNIASILEQKISAMEEAPELNYIYRAFHNVPAFRHALHQYVSALCASVEAIGDCLVASDKEQLHPAADRNPFVLNCVICTANLLAKQTAFDEEYYKCRLAVYYEHVDVQTNLHYTTESREGARSLPLNAEVLMNMNSFLFLANALCTLVTEFWTPAELSAVQAWQERGSQLGHLTLFSWSVVNSRCRAAWALIPIAMHDLFPSQRPAFAGFLPRASSEQRDLARARLRSAFTVALAITLASAYGIYFNRTLPFLAAFTIAFLAGGPVAGVTMVTSLNRAAGTVVACVWAIIVLLILANDGSPSGPGKEPSLQQQLIIGFAVVLFQIPATLVRSYPLQGYAGTCASFTICIMLFAPSLSATDSTDRIIDTFVGVVIFLAVQFVMIDAYTEERLLGHMRKVFEGVNERYTGLEQNFRRYKRQATVHHAQPGQLSELADDTPAVETLQDLHAGPVNKHIAAQRGLLLYVGMEPGLSRPPPLPASVLEECVELQGQAVRHLQVMFWAVKASIEDINPQSEVQLLRRQYVTLAVLLKPSGVALESPALPSLSHDPHLSPLPTPLSPGAGYQSPPLLLPLERSLLEVGRYLSMVAQFMTMCVRDMSQQSSSGHFKPTKNTVHNLSSASHPRSSTDYHVEFLSHFASPEELRRVAGENELLAKLEAQNVIALLSRFQAVLALLVREVVDSVTTTVVVQGVRARTPRRNKEVRVVNTMIASSVDLMRALRGLAVAVSTLRAHRDIHITQTGTRVM
jgi:uncharacterized membrane protein YgaE (UPF0421/DUF939 family)